MEQWFVLSAGLASLFPKAGLGGRFTEWCQPACCHECLSSFYEVSFSLVVWEVLRSGGVERKWVGSGVIGDDTSLRVILEIRRFCPTLLKGCESGISPSIGRYPDGDRIDDLLFL